MHIRRVAEFEASTMLSRPSIITQRTRDDASGLIMPNRPRLVTQTTRDDMMTYDQATLDSTGAFLRSELDRLDQRPYEPLWSVTWGRDIDVRSDITIADATSSFLNTAWAAPGGMEPGGVAWISPVTNAIPGVAVDIGRTINPLFLWGMEISYSIPELLTSQQLGRPIDADKYRALQVKWQMDIDRVVYIGDASLGTTGLVNNPAVTPLSVANIGGTTLWSGKDYNGILADVNALISAVWANTAWTFAPTHLLMPPTQYGSLISRLVGTSGSQSIIRFLRENSLALELNGVPLLIAPNKWLTGRGAAGTDRMIAYRKDESMVRFPMTALQKTPVQNWSLFQITTYFGKLGVVEFPRPETIGYMDGL